MVEQQVTFNLSKAKNGMSTASTKIDERPEFFLHSTVDPVKEAKDWLGRVELTPHTVYFVLGFGLGYHVQALLERLPEGSRIYVIEYSKKVNLLNAAFELYAKANNQWMLDSRISFFATGDLGELAVALAVNMGNHCINKVTLCRYYPAMIVFPEFYRQSEKELVSKVGDLFCLNFNVRITMGIRRMVNTLCNLPEIISSPGITGFSNRFAGMPAIVVAAGPSLNKNIEVLKKCSGRALVIAAGSTMGALYAHGITPNLLAVCDATEGMYEALAGVCDPKTVLLATYETNHKLVCEYPGKRLFAVDQNMLTLNGLKDLLPETDVILQSISVASTALRFALYCGANPIIFVGQDLSFSKDDPDAAQHAIGVRGVGDYLTEEWRRTYTPGYDGEEVPTVMDFLEVIRNFEGIVRRNPSISFINATEGGAKISGTVQLKLSEVYESYLSKEMFIDKNIDETYRQFVPQNCTKLLCVLSGIRKEIIQMREMAEVFVTGIVREMKAISERTEWTQPDCDRFEAQFVSFFEKVSEANIYQYIKTGIEPLQELVEYRIREGMSFQHRIDAYIQLLKNSLPVVLEQLDTAVKESIRRMENMQSEVIAQNGRQD